MRSCFLTAITYHFEYKKTLGISFNKVIYIGCIVQTARYSSGGSWLSGIIVTRDDAVNHGVAPAVTRSYPAEEKAEIQISEAERCLRNDHRRRGHRSTDYCEGNVSVGGHDIRTDFVKRKGLVCAVQRHISLGRDLIIEAVHEMHKASAPERCGYLASEGEFILSPSEAGTIITASRNNDPDDSYVHGSIDGERILRYRRIQKRQEGVTC